MNKIILIALAAVTASCSTKEPPKAEGPQQPEATAPSSMNADLLKNAPTAVFANEQVTFVPTDGHHFELKAPQDCGGFEFSAKSARKLSCQITAPGAHKIALNICDDNKEYCKPVRYELTATAPKGFVADGRSKEILQPPKHVHAPVAGFLIDETQAAVALAKKENKLLYVHFFGIWCPPCNMLEEHVYTEKSFLDATKGMVRVMIDADSDLSWDWKARFKIGGYPTVIIATAELQEIDRIVGYRPVAQMVKLATAAQDNAATPITTLIAAHDIKSAADAPEDVRERIGSYYFERREYDEARTWLEEHSDPKARRTWIRAQQEIAKGDGDDAKALELTKRLMMDFPDDIQFSSWVEQLMEAKDPAVDGFVEDAFANLKSWKTSPDLPESGYSVADIVWSEADLRAATGDEAGAKKGYLEAAELFAKMAKGSSLEVARGANMERAYALFKAGENERAKALYAELSTAYANEFSFNYNYAYVLNKLKESEKAHEFAEKAVANAYGDNWLRAMHLRAKIEHGQGKDAAAITTLDGALAEAVVPRSTAVRTHRYISRLRELRVEISTPKPEKADKE